MILDTAVVTDKLQKLVVSPFLHSLKDEAQNTLTQTMEKSSKLAREAVEAALAKEEGRYEEEKNKKGQMPSARKIADAMAALCNFVAAEAALDVLQQRLSKLN